jgi:hypothetical protein
MKSSKQECYALIQEVAVKQDPVCRHPRCYKPSVVGHHIFKRDRLATAFLPIAVWGACDDHHKFWHAHPAAFKRLAVRILGPMYYDLQRLSYTVVKNMDYGEVKRKLTEILKGGGAG